MKIEAYGATDIGLSRINNEDAFALLLKQQCFLLADGMGGHNAGEVAANETIIHLAGTIKEAHKKHLSPAEWENVLRIAIGETNAHLYHLSEQKEELSGMGTTLCLLLITDDNFICAHVGDSRIYRVRKGRLVQLTRDHSLRADLIASGELDESLALSFPHKNVITKALGTQKAVEPDLSRDEVENGDLYLIASDGLTDPLSDAQIHDLIDEARTPQEAAERLILEAKKAGGGDNITVICVEILD